MGDTIELDPLAPLVAKAKDGDREALEKLVGRLHGRVFRLTAKMLGHTEDAADATQEILIKVVTSLSAFRGESSFSTWVMRIAANHSMAVVNKRRRGPQLNFDQFGEVIDAGVAGFDQTAPVEPERAVLAEEVRIACSQGMLACLDREHRIAFILGEILELPGTEAAQVLEIEPAAFRKRLSRARERIRQFVEDRCGVYKASNPCRCALQVPHTQRTGMLDPDNLTWLTQTASTEPAEYHEVNDLLDVGALYRSQPRIEPRQSMVEILRRVLSSQ